MLLLPIMNKTQANNVNILIGLLESLPYDRYNHLLYGFVGGIHNGCALGLAVANADKFTIERKVEVPVEQRTLLQRLLGLNRTKTVEKSVEEALGWGYVEDKTRFAHHVFGPESFIKVFATRIYGVPDKDVTAQMVIERLKKQLDRVRG